MTSRCTCVPPLLLRLPLFATKDAANEAWHRCKVEAPHRPAESLVCSRFVNQLTQDVINNRSVAAGFITALFPAAVITAFCASRCLLIAQGCVVALTMTVEASFDPPRPACGSLAVKTEAVTTYHKHKMYLR